MGRNDPCFCGSGKKTKYCHAEVNENGIVANLLHLYNQIEIDLKSALAEKNISPQCHKGCSDCCHDYFYVSQVEYFGILNYMMANGIDFNETKTKAKNYMDEIEKEYPFEYRRLNDNFSHAQNKMDIRQFDDSAINKTKQGCVFLNTDTNSCDIYPVRPIICRHFGLIKRYGTCSKVPPDNYLQDTNPILEFENVDEFIINSKTMIRRPYPLANWFLFDTINNPLYKYSVECSIDEYKHLLICKSKQ